MSTPTPTQQRPPAQPSYVLRGHAAPVHAARFVRDNARLLTGDADGWVVLWGAATRRAVAVWRAHPGAAVLGLDEAGPERIVTHGRDSRLHIWHLPASAESTLSTTLPIDDAATPRPAPWLLHSLHVNTLNFCAFGLLALPSQPDAANPLQDELLLAVPGTRDECIDVFHLPSEKRISTVPGLGTKTGQEKLCLVSAYESGHVALHVLDPVSGCWSRVYTSRPHSQPPLSVACLPSPRPAASTTATKPTLTFYSSGADDVLAMHTAELSPTPTPTSAPTSAPSPQNPQTTNTTRTPTKSLLSSTFPPSTPSPSPNTPPTPQPIPPTTTPPRKTAHTHHAGQQSLVARSDGRLLATGGWDSRIRVYSARSLKELAVLAWHAEGVYSVGFAVVGEGEGEGKDEERRDEAERGERSERVERGMQAQSQPEIASVRQESGVGVGVGAGTGAAAMRTVRKRREDRVRRVHWLAAGAKDGKVSLWDIY